MANTAKSPNFWNHCLTILRYLIRRFIHENYTYRAAALTFTTLLAIVPLLSVSFTVFAAFPGFNDVRAQLQTTIVTNLVASSGQVVQNYLNGFIDHAAHLSFIGVIFLIVTALMMIYTIVTTINSIWRVKRRHQGIIAFLIYWSLLTLTPILLGASLVASNYLLASFSSVSHAAGLEWLIINTTSFLLTFIIISILYIAIPSCQVPVRYGVSGALVASILLEFVHFGFILYVKYFQAYQAIYGTLAALPLFLMWLYSAWLIILFGALVSHVLTLHYAFNKRIHASNFSVAFYWLGHLWQAQQEGNGLTLAELIQREGISYSMNPEKILLALENAKLIKTVDYNRIILSRDLHNFSLGDLYHALPWKLPSTIPNDPHPNRWEYALKEFIEIANTSIQQQANQVLSEVYGSCEVTGE